MVSQYYSLHSAMRTMLVLSLFSRVISQNVGDVRLVDGSGTAGGTEGRVEVFSSIGPGNEPTWEGLCDAVWDINIARVVCRQAGFDGLEKLHRNSPFRSGGQRPIIRLDGCTPNAGATSLEEAGCQEAVCKGRRRDAGVSCLVRPASSPMLPMDNREPTPVIAATSVTAATPTVQAQITRTPSTSEATSTVSTVATRAFTSMTSDYYIVSTDSMTTDLMTTDSNVTQDRLPLKDLNVAGIYTGVTLCCLIIAIIIIIIFLRHRCKSKVSRGKRSQGSSGDRENNFPDNEYQYNAVDTVENGPTIPRMSTNNTGEDYQYSAVGPTLNGTDVEPRVPKQDSVDEYQYSAVGPIKNGADVEPRVPKQDSVDEYQYSAVGPIQNGADVKPRVPKQDSVDEYQYSAVGPIQNGADIEPRFPRQNSGDDDFYAPVGATSSDTLTPKATAFANVSTDESFYIIPERPEVNPYQELTVKSTTFAGLQKLRKKPVLEQNTQRATEGNVTKQPPGKPKKPMRMSQTPIEDTPAQKSAVPRPTPAQRSSMPYQPTEVDNAVYGLEVIGSQNHFAASLAANEQNDDRCESIYANDIELRKLSPPRRSAVSENYSTHGIENPYENSIIGDPSFVHDDEDEAYQALSRQATLPV